MNSTNMNVAFQTGMWSPIKEQAEHIQLDIQGILPPELRGSYYRNGPNPLILNQPGYHQFDGDGMVHCIKINSNKAFYTNRWIETDKYNIESHFQEKIFS